MNINHYQTKRDRSYFEWSDNMQIIRKGKGDIAMTESELVDFFNVIWKKLNYQLQLLLKIFSLHPEERNVGGDGSIRERTATRLCSALSAYYHYRFVLSIGQHGSPFVQKTPLSRATTPFTCSGADIPTLQ